MLSCSTVGQLLAKLNLIDSLQQQVSAELEPDQAQKLLTQLQRLPLKRSRAVTRLGSYSCRGAEPLAIRLQFVQEEDQLRQTLLHEIAHFLDHQTREQKRLYRNPHGRSWKYWLQQVGGRHLSAESEAMSALYQQRLKPVARCKRCGFVLKRLQRLTRGRRWLHRSCGGRLVPLD